MFTNVGTITRMGTPPLHRPLPPPITETDLKRIKRNSRIELWICLGVGTLAAIVAVAVGWL